MDAILKINNDYSYLVTSDQKVRNFLWSKLRFRKEGYFHTRAYKQGIWDGYIDFFNKKTGRFLTGLLPEVRLVLNTYGVPFDTEDDRVITQFLYESIDDQFLTNPENPITLYDYQVDLVNKAIFHKRGIIQAPTSAGKAQPLDATIYTPYGPKKIGETKIGDLVCTPDGGTGKIINIFPQGKKEVYKITFSNNDTVECCKEHLWLVDSIRDKWHSKVKSTQYLLDNYKSKRGILKYKIQTTKNVKFFDKSVNLHPYLLGVMLGDGTLGKHDIKISNDDPEIIDLFNSLLREDYTLKHDNGCDWYLAKKIRGKKENIYLNYLRDYRLDGKRSWEKFIPDDYKYNSFSIRMNLVRGLMDTDGYIDKKGCTSYTTTSKKLCYDLKEVVESIGGLGRVTEKIKKYKYKGETRVGRLAYNLSISFPVTEQLFNCSRKRERCILQKRPFKNRIIKDISPCGEKECVCILVDHPDHMYLTDNFVPTHNTEIMIAIMKALPPKTPILFLANRKDLIVQNYKRMKQWGLSNVGRFYGEYHEPNIITCCTVQSAHHLDKLLPKFKAVVADEIHMLSNDTSIKTFKKLKGASIRLAVSATPFKDGGKDDVQKYAIKGYFGPVLKVKKEITESGILTTNFLQERGTVSDSLCTFYKIKEPKIPYDIFIDAVTNGIANNWHFHHIVERLAKKLKGRTLILVDRIVHGDILHGLIPDSLWVNGKDTTETRSYVIEQMQQSKKNIVAIATQQIFSVGINFFVHNMINAAGGKAEHEIVQRMGRGLRTAKDKAILNYYDFLFEINPYLDDHSLQRVKILNKEKHEVIIKEDIDF